MTPFLIVLLSACAMEPAAAILHRAVMHGFGWSWHRSHHQPRRGVIERNDLYPLVFALSTIAVMALATWSGVEVAIWMATGVTLYGFAYLFVHDVVIHRRILRLPSGMNEWGYFRHVRNAHRVHHLYNRAPFGFLVPLVPVDLAERARDDHRNPFEPRRSVSSV